VRLGCFDTMSRNVTALLSRAVAAAKSMFSSRSKDERPEAQVPVPVLDTQLNNPSESASASSDNPTRWLLCLVEGEETLSKVHVDANGTIFALRQSIHQGDQHGTLSRIDEKHLILLKVTESPVQHTHCSSLFYAFRSISISRVIHGMIFAVSKSKLVTREFKS
jgi:hypothetical protein